ncbi:MAG: VWA domain-containing protein [Bacteroidales bacterium]
MTEGFVHICNGAYEYQNPEFLWGFLLIPILIVWYVFSHTKRARVYMPTLIDLEGMRGGVMQYISHVPIVFRMLALSCFIIALARPVSVDSYADSTSYGVDIMLAMDISGSMLAQDLKPDRIEASKDIAAQFVNSREQDRIGLVVFSGESYTQCPLTADHTTLINLLSQVETGIIEDGTAIGMGLSLAVTRLQESDAVSKVVILLTDGVNNAGDIEPATAAELARKRGVRVYTIGVGSRGKAPFPMQTMFGTQIQYVDVEIDEESLKYIAEQTDGKYFRATNNKDLRTIYEEIDTLEKTKIEDFVYTTKKEEYAFFVLWGLALLAIEILLRFTVLKKFP